MSVTAPEDFGKQAPQQPAQASAFSPKPTTASFDWRTTGTPGGLSRSASSEILTRATTALSESVKTLGLSNAYQLTLLKVDNTKEKHLRYPSILVAIRPADSSLKMVSFYTLLLENGEPIPARVDNINGANITVDQFPDAVFDTRYLQTVTELVTGFAAGADVYQNSATVVPRDFNWEDKEAVRRLLVLAAMAAVNGIEYHTPGFKDIDVTKADRSSLLQVSPSFHQETRYDYVGLPVRNDVSLVLSAVSVDNPTRDSLNTPDRSTTLAQLGGFIDLVWAPVNQQPVYGMVQQGPRTKFAARLVLTWMESLTTMTIASQLLALLAAYQLNENNNYYQYFLPRNGAGLKGVDPKDVGAINIEGNISNDPSGYGQYQDTKRADITPTDIGTLLAMTVSPGMLLSLDVGQCSTDTWYNEVFSAASGTGEAAEAARRAILAAAEQLFGGHFSTYYTTNESPVYVNDEQVLNGWYDTAEGRRDIRDVDYLYIANTAGRTDPVYCTSWSDAQVRTEYPIERRLQEQKKMILNVAPSAKFTGKSKRVTFTRQFIDACIKSAIACNLPLRMANVNNIEFQNARGVASFVEGGLLSPQSSGLFQAGTNGGGAQAGANFGRNMANRWG